MSTPPDVLAALRTLVDNPRPDHNAIGPHYNARYRAHIAALHAATEALIAAEQQAHAPVAPTLCEFTVRITRSFTSYKAVTMQGFGNDEREAAADVERRADAEDAWVTQEGEDQGHTDYEVGGYGWRKD